MCISAFSPLCLFWFSACSSLSRQLALSRKGTRWSSSTKPSQLFSSSPSPRSSSSRPYWQINTLLCPAFRVYPNVRASVICYYLALYIRSLWVYWKQNFYAAKNIAEHRNVGTQHFLQLFSTLTYFVKFAMSTKKEQFNRLVRLLFSIRFSIFGTTSVPCKSAG